MQKFKSNHGFAIFLGVIWGIMAVVYFFSIKSVFTYDNSYSYTNPEYVLGAMMEENYGGAYQRTEAMLTYGLEVSKHPECKEIVAEHDYMEAAALYRIYFSEGLTELADKYKARMDEASSNLGKISYITKEIDAALGLTE